MGSVLANEADRGRTIATLLSAAPKRGRGVRDLAESQSETVMSGAGGRVFLYDGLSPVSLTAWSAHEPRHNSFSASARNSSGTERDAPNMTEPYPTESHPKRFRILSTAQSAARRAMPLLVPGRNLSSPSPNESSICNSESFSRFDTDMAKSEMVLSVG